MNPTNANRDLAGVLYTLLGSPKRFQGSASIWFQMSEEILQTRDYMRVRKALVWAMRSTVAWPLLIKNAQSFYKHVDAILRDYDIHKNNPVQNIDPKPAVDWLENLYKLEDDRP